MTSVRVERVAFAFTAAAPLFERASFHLAPGWTGVVGENGAGKSTLLRIVARELAPLAGRVQIAPEDATVVLCPQSVEHLEPHVLALAGREDGDARRLRGRLALDPSELDRWPTLSPGERKRWQVGAALAREPDLLLLDEPTNHVDGEARALLVDALRDFAGVGLLVSHDRALLEGLTLRTLRVAHGEVALHRGSYGVAKAEWEARARAALEERSSAQKEAARAARALDDARRRREAAARSMSGRRHDPGDHDARSVGAKTLRSWAESRLGKDVGRRRASLERARDAVPDAPPRVDLGRSVIFDFVPSHRRTLLALDARAVPLGGERALRDVQLRLGRTDRVRLEGPNGAGKTTLLSALLEASAPEPKRVLYLRQEVPTTEAGRLLDEVRRLDPVTRGRVLSLVAALGSDPARLLASRSPSPGETRKLQLALGLGRLVWALVLDEPTNHLDLPTVERLTDALCAYPGALLLVTHDDAFAAACTRTVWSLRGDRVEVR